MGPRAALSVLVLLVASNAFAPVQQQRPRAAALHGIFDAFANAFKNEDFSRDDVRCRCRHILVASEERALELLSEIKAAEAPAKAFADVARRESTCASAPKGGDLGEFGMGKMVAPFDAAVFPTDEAPPPAGSLLGPVQTQFGSHLILVTDRSTNNDQVTELLARND